MNVSKNLPHCARSNGGNMPTLNWIGKEKVVNHADAVPFHVLEQKYNFGGASENKIIHGDNLLALKSLLPEYERRVKCIYIDPPYNTGNEGWIYNDKVNAPQIKKWLGEVVGREGEDLSRHDKWLCMMYPRLKLLKKLLADDGAIFISIDDNEQANLKLICDEVFGSQNFVGIISNTNNPKGRSDDKFIATAHEYIFVYAKKIEFLTWRGFEPGEEITRRYNKVDNNGKKYREIDLRKTGENDLREDRPNLFYYFYYNETTGDFFPEVEKKFLEGYICIKPIRADGKEGNWRWGIETAKNNLSDLIPKFMPARRIWGVMQKDFLENREYVKPTSSWSFKDVNSERGTEIFLNLGFNKRDFPKPKPVGTVERILQLATDKDSIILDSFAGSGTTAHAVLKLNAEDGGNRKFILVEMENYSETITAERVRRVIQGYGEVEGTGSNFDFYEVGEPLMINDEINENIAVEKICAYVWYTETHTPYKKPSGNNSAYLGEFNGTGIYFHYEKGNLTTLDAQFLRSIEIQAENYLIYADECGLSEKQLEDFHITFKKIPRDIKKIWSNEI